MTGTSDYHNTEGQGLDLRLSAEGQGLDLGLAAEGQGLDLGLSAEGQGLDLGLPLDVASEGTSLPPTPTTSVPGSTETVDRAVVPTVR